MFVPKQYPKYIHNKIRVFAPSNLLKATLIAAALFTTYRYSLLNPDSSANISQILSSSLTPNPNHNNNNFND